MLKLENVSVYRGEKKTVEGVSFVVGRGEVLILRGPNGSGKSTLLSAIAGAPDVRSEGVISDEAGEIGSLPAHARFCRGIMLVYQEPPALPGISFATLAREMVSAHRGERIEIAPLYHELRSALARVGLPVEYIDRSLHEGFSGGEKKRAELALLLLAKPAVALIDEIDAGLDAEGRTMAAEILGELQGDGASLVIVTHNPVFADVFPGALTFALST